MDDFGRTTKLMSLTLLNSILRMVKMEILCYVLFNHNLKKKKKKRVQVLVSDCLGSNTGKMPDKVPGS